MDRTRASDSERERVVELLREAAVAGRLTIEELDARCERAYAAVTLGEFAILLEDLPADLARRVLPDTRSADAELSRSVPKHLWPGPSPWMVGDLRFYVRWSSPGDLHEMGAQIMRSVVPSLRRSNYEIVEQAADELVLRRARPDLTQRGFIRQAEVRIVMTDGGDHTIAEAYGEAPQLVRQAIARLAG
jgi:hypothetical protein